MVLIILFIIVLVVGFLFAKVQYLGAKQSLFLIIFLFRVYFNYKYCLAILICMYTYKYKRNGSHNQGVSHFF